MGLIKILAKNYSKVKVLNKGKRRKREPRKDKEGSVRKKFGAMKYSDAIVFDVYEAKRMGLSDADTVKYLQINHSTFIEWRTRYPLFRMAIERGAAHEKNGDGTVTFRDYVYKRLDPKLQELWDEINACEKERNGVVRMEALFAKHGRIARQHLFLYALTASNFNASRACQKVGVTKTTIQRWTENDPRFAELMDEIHWHKGNFFETALVGAVKNGETGAIIFANRTFNKDRGYGIKVEHEVSGTVNHLHAMVDFEQLDLPLDVQRAVLEAIQRKEAAAPKAIGYTEQAIDVEFTHKDEKVAG